MHSPIGYCPWCGNEITVVGWDFRNSELEWSKCRNLHRPCRGALITIITDYQGFVIHPYHRKGYYILSRHIEKKEN